MKTLHFLLGVGLAVTVANSHADSPTWTRVNPRPHGDFLSGVRFLGDQFVAVGENGRFGTSPDGITWDWRQVPGATNIVDVSLLDGRYVCTNLQRFFYSDDGINWMPSTDIDPEYTIGRVIAAQGRYFATGYWLGKTTIEGEEVPILRGVVLTSTDGTTWTEAFTMGGSAQEDRVQFGDMLYAQGQFLVTAYQFGTNERWLITSPDGVDWTPRAPSEDINFSEMAFGDGRYVGVGGFGFATSTDGTTWTANTDVTTPRSTIAYGDGKFVSIPSGIVFNDAYAASTTTNGEAWTTAPLDITSPLAGIAYGNNTFVAVGSSGKVLTSPDGSDWTLRTPGAVRPHPLWAVASDGDRLVAVSEGYGTALSENGTEWSEGAAPYVLKSILHDGNQFVAAGGLDFEATAIVTSPDGVDWTPRDTAGVSTVIYDLAYRPDPPQKYVAVGGALASLILSSDDATIWTDNSPTGELIHQATLNGVAYGNGTFVAVGDAVSAAEIPTLMVSPDGVDWFIPVSPPEKVSLNSVDFINGRFVAGGQNFVLSSTDGISWTRHDVPGASSINAVAFHDGLYVAVARFGGIFESPDLDTWTAVPALTSLELRDVRHLGDAFYAVGPGATILRGAVASSLPVLSVARNPVDGTLELTWETAPGVILQESTDLGSFTDLPEATSPHDPGGGPGPRFFRLRTEP